MIHQTHISGGGGGGGGVASGFPSCVARLRANSVPTGVMTALPVVEGWVTPGTNPLLFSINDAVAGAINISTGGTYTFRLDGNFNVPIGNTDVNLQFDYDGPDWDGWTLPAIGGKFLAFTVTAFEVLSSPGPLSFQIQQSGGGTVGTGDIIMQLLKLA